MPNLYKREEKLCMSEDNEAQVLIDQIRNSVRIINELKSQYDGLHKHEIKLLGKGNASAALLADIFVSFYTCCETIFMRITQFFENSLDKKQWHKDLLNRMTLEISGVRPSVLRNETSLVLDDFLRFRHFKRYYFEFNYDWDRIEFLKKKYQKVIPLVKKDLEDFYEFIEKVKP